MPKTREKRPVAGALIHGGTRRVAFVTVGATAGFRPLLQEVLSEPFLAKLLDLGYTQLVIQCGPDGDFVKAHIPRRQWDESKGEGRFLQDIDVFAYTDEMAKWMCLAGPGTDEDGGQRGYGVIIAHAGPFLS